MIRGGGGSIKAARMPINDKSFLLFGLSCFPFCFVWNNSIFLNVREICVSVIPDSIILQIISGGNPYFIKIVFPFRFHFIEKVS